MKSFRVSDGDLSVSSSGRADVVRGRDKLLQDLALWLLEPLGRGYTTPAFGSRLDSLVGTGRSGTAAEVESEVGRVLALYQENQVQSIRRAQVQGRLHLYGKQEILDAVRGIEAVHLLDRVVVRARIVTGSGVALTMLAGLDESGVSVSAAGGGAGNAVA